MALTVKTNFVKEDIIDENGNKLGEIIFNPKDSRIMSKLSIILKEITEAANKVNNIKIDDIPEGKIENIEDFTKFSEICNKWLEATNIENEIIEKVINELTEIFGEKVINCFTQGTNDLESLMPLIEFILPYIKVYKSERVNSYIPSKNDDVMG